MNSPIIALMGLGYAEVIAIVILLFLLFGASKLPALAKGIAQSIRELRNLSKEDDTHE